MLSIKDKVFVKVYENSEVKSREIKIWSFIEQRDINKVSGFSKVVGSLFSPNVLGKVGKLQIIVCQRLHVELTHKVLEVFLEKFETFIIFLYGPSSNQEYRITKN